MVNKEKNTRNMLQERLKYNFIIKIKPKQIKKQKLFLNKKAKN